MQNKREAVRSEEAWHRTVCSVVAMVMHTLGEAVIYTFSILHMIIAYTYILFIH